MQTNQRLKILLTAHELSPLIGSECSSGWNVITRLGTYHDIFVLYAETNQFETNNYKDQIDDYVLKYGSIAGVNFIPVPQPVFTRKIASFNKSLSHKQTSVGISFLYFLGVRFWEKAVFIKAKELMKVEKIDIIHHFNHLSFREPGYLWKLDKPFIWGPASGLSLVPISFLMKLPFKEVLNNVLRNSLNLIQVFLSKRIQNAIQKSKIIYFVTKEDGTFFSKRNSNISHLLDTGGYSSNGFVPKKIKEGRIKILWVGRLSHLKALELLFQALDCDENLKSQIDIIIIGDGPQKEYYKKIATELKIDTIEWLGQIPKDQVLKKMAEADFLVHTSIKEAASAVILESLSVGLPVVCHDAFGIGFAINDACGLKVPFVSPKVSVTGIYNAIAKLVSDRKLLINLSEGAINRSNEYSWDSMAETIAKDYHKIYNKNANTINK